MPEELNRRAEELLGGTGWAPPPTRDAATVILLRDADGGLEVFLQRRPGSMAFAAGMLVFPGGRVEDSDADAAVPWSGESSFEPFPSPPGAGPTASFRALTVAGARETWEEAGVALVEPVPWTQSQSGRQDRDRRIGAGESPPSPQSGAVLLDWLVGRGWAVAGHRMLPWAHWVTPEVERRRYDTRFLVARLPAGAVAGEVGAETAGSGWFRPADALTGLREARMPMLPPTADALVQLADFADVAGVLADAAGRRPRPLLPRPHRGRTSGLTWRLVDAYTGEVIRR